MTVNRRVLKQLEEVRLFHIDHPELMSQKEWVDIRDEIEKKLDGDVI